MFSDERSISEFAQYQLESQSASKPVCHLEAAVRFGILCICNDRHHCLRHHSPFPKNLGKQEIYLLPRYVTLSVILHFTNDTELRLILILS